MVQQISDIESKHFKIRGIDVKFQLVLAPSDMKFVAILAGQLTNSSTYPCTFAKVSKSDFMCIEKSQNWLVWSYEDRIRDAQKVQKFKDSLPIYGKSNRPKITQYIASLKSRQEYPPVIGKYIDKVKAEPLHLKNNAWQQWHMHVFRVAILRTPKAILDKTNEIGELGDCVFKAYYAMLKTCKLGKIAWKIRLWFREDRKKNKALEIRFTGEESLKLRRNFMLAIEALHSDSFNDLAQFKTHVLAYAGYHLREAVALFSRFNLTESDVVTLEEACTKYYRVCDLFLNVTLTIWTIGNVVPVHVKECMSEFGLGLAINTLHGREAKHLRLRDYTRKARVDNRWQTAFRHEYMSTIWLKQHDLSTLNSNESSEEFPQKEYQNHIPVKYLDSEEFCYCGLTKSGGQYCKFCSSNVRKDIDISCQKGKKLKPH